MGCMKDAMKKEIIDFFKTFAIAFVVIYTVSHVIFVPVKVFGSSMFPTLHDGDICFAGKLAAKAGTVNRFDIVVIDEKEGEQYLIKRVIGLPGETISCNDSKIYINGIEEYDESYLGDNVVTGSFDPVTLGEDEYFCLGDNRSNSKDSRYFGAFRKEDIVAKGIFVLYPFNRAGMR